MRQNKFKMHFAYLETPPEKSPFGFISLMLSKSSLEDILRHDKNKEVFTPPYPATHANKVDRFKRFFLGLHSWIHTLYEKAM